MILIVSVKLLIDDIEIFKLGLKILLISANVYFWIIQIFSFWVKYCQIQIWIKIIFFICNVYGVLSAVCCFQSIGTRNYILCWLSPSLWSEKTHVRLSLLFITDFRTVYLFSACFYAWGTRSTATRTNY